MEKVFRSSLYYDLLFVLFLAVLFAFLGARLQGVRTPAHGDQSSFLELAANLRDGQGFAAHNLSPFHPRKEITHPEGIRQPLLPLILSAIATRDFSFFLKARWLVWALSLVSLLVIYGCASRLWDRPAAFILAVLLGLNVHYQTFASEIWCENLLLIWVFAAVAAVHQYFHSEKWRPLPKWLLLAGALAAMAYYTKASAAALPIGLAGLGMIRFVRALRRRFSTNEQIYHSSIAPFLYFIFAFMLVLLPYVILNIINTGTLLRNVDLQANMWVLQTKEYYLPYESPPGPSRLLRDLEQPFLYALNRWSYGAYRQLGNHLDALRLMPFGQSWIVPFLLWAAALFNLVRYPLRGWRGFVFCILGFNFAVASWYVVTDVSPRFIWISVPLVLLHASLGIMGGIRWAGRRLHLESLWPAKALCVLPFLMLFSGLWMNREVFQKRAEPLDSSEMFVIDFLAGQTAPEDVLLMGPSHQLPWNYLWNRRYIFVPHYEDWEAVLDYAHYFSADYFLLDQELWNRRREIFEPFIGWSHERGLWLKTMPPGLEGIYQNPAMPSAFMLFRVMPEEEQG